MWSVLVTIFPYAIIYTIPILAAALGGVYSEHSGVVNLGLEGLMCVGFFASAIVIKYTAPYFYSHYPEGSFMFSTFPIIVGIVVAIIAGGLFSLLHAFASINLKADQIISGTAINMLATALTVYFSRTFTGSGNIRIIQGIIPKNVPFLSKIPIIGPLLFTKTYWSSWLVLIILGLSWFFLYKTSFGLRLRACGEHPQAVQSAGINVYHMRYFGVVMSGCLSGLGGACILVTYGNEFNGTVSGLGFLALAAMIFGQWKPLGVLGASFFFGLATTIANVSQVIPQLESIPLIVLKTFPFVVTLIALVIFSKKSAAPKCDGVPF